MVWAHKIVDWIGAIKQTMWKSLEVPQTYQVREWALKGEHFYECGEAPKVPFLTLSTLRTSAYLWGQL